MRLINEKPAEELTDAVDPYLDLRGLTRFAIQNFIGEIDGFAGKWGRNNFYLYRLQHQAQHRIIAWDDDLTFLDTVFDVTSFQEPNVLVKKPRWRCRAPRAVFPDAGRSRSIGRRSASDTEAGALESEIRGEIDVINSAMLADTRRSSQTPNTSMRDYMTQFAARRARYVECEVARLSGGLPCSSSRCPNPIDKHRCSPPKF